MRSSYAMGLCKAAIAGITLAAATSAPAQEATKYTYDELGRLKTVVKTGGPSNGVATSYAYDKASNRTNVKVENSTNGTDPGTGGASAATQGFVVVPLNGYSLIFYVR